MGNNMIKADGIMEVLEKYYYEITDQAGCTFNIIDEDDFSEIAEKIIELFNNPDDGNE